MLYLTREEFYTLTNDYYKSSHRNELTTLRPVKGLTVNKYQIRVSYESDRVYCQFISGKTDDKKHREFVSNLPVKRLNRMFTACGCNVRIVA